MAIRLAVYELLYPLEKNGILQALVANTPVLSQDLPVPRTLSTHRIYNSSDSLPEISYININIAETI
jgi:hypothetical protein